MQLLHISASVFPPPPSFSILSPPQYRSQQRQSICLCCRMGARLRRRSPSPSTSWQSKVKKGKPLHDGTGIKVDLSSSPAYCILTRRMEIREGRDGDAAAEPNGDKDGRPLGLIKLPLLTLTRRGRRTILKTIRGVLGARHTEFSLLLEFYELAVPCFHLPAQFNGKKTFLPPDFTADSLLDIMATVITQRYNTIP